MITIKIVGGLLVIAGCGAFGMLLAMQYRREIVALRQLMQALDFMHSELDYRLTPLPELCRKAAELVSGNLRMVFIRTAEEMENQISPNVQMCLAAARHKSSELPKYASEALSLLGQSLGNFDLHGQLKGLDAVCSHCNRILEELESNKPQRIRNYQTLGLCAGAALAILFI